MYLNKIDECLKNVEQHCPHIISMEHETFGFSNLVQNHVDEV